MRCPTCGHENVDPRAKFCSECGSRMKLVLPGEVKTLTDLESVIKRHASECETWDVLYCVNEARKELMHDRPSEFLSEATNAFDYCDECPEVWIALFSYFHQITMDYEPKGM